MIKPEALASLIKNCAPEAYFVGGAVRDALMKRYCGDIDLAMPRELVKPCAVKLAAKLKASAFEMDPDFCVWRVTAKSGLQIDLCAFVGKDIKADLKRRDFTINALAYPVSSAFKIKTKPAGKKLSLLLTSLKKENIIDLNGGIDDIKNKTVRANNSKVFTEDPLRLLRAFRVCAELKFKIEDKTLSLIKKSVSAALNPAGERIQEEFKRIFAAANTANILRAMDGAGLLSALIPQLEDQKTCAICYYGEGGVFTHTMKVVERIEFLLNNLEKAFPKFHKKIKPYAQDTALYKMTALLHDIAKPATAKMINGRLRFFHHEERGSEMAEKFLKKLKYSCDAQKLICKMIYYHLRPSNLASNEIVTDKGIYKFFKELGPAGLPMLLLCWADYTSYVRPMQVFSLMRKSVLPVMTMEEAKKKDNIGKTLRHMQMLNFLFGKYFNESKRFVAPPKIIDGRDIMSVLNVPPGPRVGRILEAVTLAQVEGKIKNKEQALALLEKNKSAFLRFDNN
ncbi:CCA tRNA nucleotidyltransferase [Candidatus Proelusimicrobium excrementi]|uniref:CCA tRNA nucleotidyltransferase n=1 Tax=Candidatus Proelusimicrobium excrementi TaxID=3416222 RepID=UPI003D10016B